MASSVLSTIVRVKDEASGPMRRMVASGQQFNNMMMRGQAIADASFGKAARAGAIVGGYTDKMNKAAASSEKFNRGTRDLGITLTGMLKVMAMFAINLQIINAATAPYRFLKGAIEKAAEFQDATAQINALLRMGDDELKKFSLQSRKTAGEYGHSMSDINKATKEIASSISAMNIAGHTEGEAVQKMVGVGAKLATLDNAEVLDATNALKRVMTTLYLPMEHLDHIARVLWGSIDVGTLTLKNINQEIGTFMGTLSSLTGHMSDLAKVKWAEDTMAFFSHVSNVLPASEAATGVNRFFLNMTKRGSQTRQAARELKAATGARVGPEDFLSLGLSEWLKELGGFFASDSPELKRLMDKYVSWDKVPEHVTEEAIYGAATGKIMGLLFPNVRAARPVNQLVNQIMQYAGEGGLRDQYADAISAQSYERAISIAMDTMNRQKGRFDAIMESFKISMGMPIVKQATVFFKGISDAMEQVVNVEGFDDYSPKQKMSKVIEVFNNEIDFMWNQQGGPSGFASEFVDTLVIFLTQGVERNMDKFMDIGESIITGIFTGAIKATGGKILDPRHLVTSPLFQAALLKRFTPMGWGASLGTAMIANNMSTNMMGGDIMGLNSNMLMLGGLAFYSYRNRMAAAAAAAAQGGVAAGAGAMAGPMVMGPLAQATQQLRKQSANRNIRARTSSGVRANLRTPEGRRMFMQNPMGDARMDPLRRANENIKNAQARLRNAAKFRGMGGTNMMAMAAPLLMSHMMMSGMGGSTSRGGLTGVFSGDPTFEQIGMYRTYGDSLGENIYNFGSQRVGPASQADVMADMGTMLTMGAVGGAAVGSMFGGIGAVPGLLAGSAVGLGAAGSTFGVNTFLGGRDPSKADYAMIGGGATAGGALGGAALGAAIGAPLFGVGAIPGAIVGGLLGGAALGGGAMWGLGGMSQRHAARRQAIHTDESAIMHAFGIPEHARGLVSGLVEAGRAEGLKRHQMDKLLATGLAITQAESGWRANVNVDDPSTSGNMQGRAIGLWQMHTQQGGYRGKYIERTGRHDTESFIKAMSDPKVATSFAAPVLAKLIKDNPNILRSPDFAGEFAALGGWPLHTGWDSVFVGGREGTTGMGMIDGNNLGTRAHLDKIATLGGQYLEQLQSEGLFSEFAQGQNNLTNVTISVDGDLNINADTNGELYTNVMAAGRAGGG